MTEAVSIETWVVTDGDTVVAHVKTDTDVTDDIHGVMPPLPKKSTHRLHWVAEVNVEDLHTRHKKDLDADASYEYRPKSELICQHLCETVVSH